MKSYSVEEFYKVISSPKEVDTKNDTSAIGLIKVPSEDIPTIIPLPSPPFFLFSPGFSNSFWLPISYKIITSIDHFGKGDFLGQKFDIVRIHFKVSQELEALILEYNLYNGRDSDCENKINDSIKANDLNFGPTCREECLLTWSIIIAAAATIGGPLGAAAVAAAQAGLYDCWHHRCR